MVTLDVLTTAHGWFYAHHVLPAGWGNIKNRQLRELLEAYKTPDEALKLLLRGSNRMQQEHQRQQQQEHPKQQQGTSHISAESDEEDFVIVSRRTRVDSVEAAVKEEHAWFQLKTDISMNPAVRAGTVPETDERGPLRGQKGIWATENVPAGSVLGAWHGLLSQCACQIFAC